MQDLFSTLDKKICDLQTRKAIILGSVGSGKTSLGKYVAGDYEGSNESRLSGKSVTIGVKTYRGKYLGSNESSNTQTQYTMIDSEGYGADGFSSDNLRNQLVNALKFETELNCVIICVSFERFRNGLKEDLTHLLGVIKTLGLGEESLLMVFTHCEVYKPEKREEFVKEFKEYFKFDFGKNYVFCCFANMNEVNDNYKPIVIKDVLDSITVVRQKIFERKNVINVAMKICEMESPK